MRRRTKNNAQLPTTTIRRKKRSLRTRHASRLLVVAIGSLLIGLMLFLGLSSRSARSRMHHKPHHRRRLASVEPTDGIYDVAVVGSGPAGLSAALFAARSALAVTVFGTTAQSLLAEATSLDNFPSWNRMDKPWLQSTRQQVQEEGAHLADPTWTVTGLSQESSKDPFVLQTSSNSTVKAWSVVIATGATPRRLHLPHEDMLWGDSIHSCAICDGSNYGPEDTVVVVGGGDAAVAAALYLARTVRQVVVVHRRHSWARPQNRRAVQSMQAMMDKIRVITPHYVKEWIVEESGPLVELVGVRIAHMVSQGEETIHAKGAFLMIGAEPNTNWLHSIRLDNAGYIELPSIHNSTMKQATSMKGVFGAGEVTSGDIYRQAITASAQGAQAGMDVERWLVDQQLGSTAGESSVQYHQQIYKEEQEEEERQRIQAEQEALEISCDLKQKNCILHVVQQFPVVVFEKPWCPYCQMALEAFASLGLGDPSKLKIINLEEYDSHHILKTLETMTGRHTFPQVFIGGTNIGGGTETSKMHKSGKLKTLLQQAGALK